jgi:predicted metallo-beta-lactamase superfamily hydrolase
MTLLDISFRYNLPPGEAEMRALNAAREVYGIRAIRMSEKERIVSVEFDASRLSDEQVESLLRRAGVDIEARIALP